MGKGKGGCQSAAPLIVLCVSPLDSVAPDPVLLVGRADIPPFGLPRAAFIDGDRAARVEYTAARRAQRARHVAQENDALALTFHLGVRDGHSRQESLRVRVQRVLEDRVPVRQLHHVAEVHHAHAVADVADDREVVRDEQVRQVELVLQVLEQVDDLRLDGHVQRRDRLIADDEVWLNCQRPGDADALTLAARELVREAVGEVRVQAHRLEQVLDALLLLLAAGQLVDGQGLADDAADRHTRVQARVGVLEDHLHFPAEAAKLTALHLRQVGAFEIDLPGSRAGQLEDCLPGRALAAPRFADEPEGLTAADLEAQAIDGTDISDLALEDHARGDGEEDLEVFDLDKGFADGAGPLAGTRASLLRQLAPPDERVPLPSTPHSASRRPG